MKKFLLKIVFFACVCVILTVLPCILIDPYNVFHWDNVRENGVEPNKNYIKVKYILANPDKFDTLLFGSSRAGVIHVENIEDEKCYNMSYSEGLPCEYLMNLETLTSNGVIPKKVYISLDSLGYTIDPESHYNTMRYPYEKLDTKSFVQMYFQPNMAFDSLDTIASTRDQRMENYSDIFYNCGWWCDYGVDTLSEEDLIGMMPYIGGEKFYDENLEAIQGIKDLCDEYGIEACFFTNPMFEVTYRASVEKDYYKFLKDIAKITDFWNFSSLNDVTTNLDCFFDSSHYTPEVGDMLMEIINGEYEVDDELKAQGFGVYVTGDNVKKLVKELKKQIAT